MWSVATAKIFAWTSKCVSARPPPRPLPLCKITKTCPSWYWWTAIVKITKLASRVQKLLVLFNLVVSLSGIFGRLARFSFSLSALVWCSPVGVSETLKLSESCFDLGASHDANTLTQLSCVCPADRDRRAAPLAGVAASPHDAAARGDRQADPAGRQQQRRQPPPAQKEARVRARRQNFSRSVQATQTSERIFVYADS